MTSGHLGADGLILEGVVTTIGANGRVNISPMGPLASPDMRRLTLRPFRTSRTYENLKAHGEAVFHVTDDVELLARSAVGDVEAELKPARSVRGFILSGACRAYELRVTSLDEREERVTIEADVVRTETMREFFGLNRAKHAVVEAAILATRVHLLPIEEILAKYAELEPLVRKTGGAAESRAFGFLKSHVESAGQSAPTRSVHVVTGSRLHFGLISPASDSGRRYGGAGLMVARPAIDLRVERCEQETRATGPLAARALEIARRVSNGDTPRVRMEIAAAPREHTGLGTGTQLALAVARAVAALERSTPRASELAARTGRGRRSAIGVHGFERGGFLVDGGKAEENDGTAPLLIHHAVPEAWRFVLVTPREGEGIHGREEEDSFRSIENDSEDAAASLCRVLLLGLAPALLEADLAGFGEALYEYGARSGECFKRSQGGIFASREIAACVELIRGEGIRGAGQSSWGPTVFAVVESDERAGYLSGKIRARFGDARVEVTVTEALNQGARTRREAAG